MSPRIGILRCRIPTNGLSTSPRPVLSGIFRASSCSAKRYQHRGNDIGDFLSDRLYGMDSNGGLVSGPFAMPDERLNGKLVRDHSGNLYQLNLERGLVRLADGQPIVPPGSVPVDSEPRHGLQASVYVGFQGEDRASWGRPVLDAAFDAPGTCTWSQWSLPRRDRSAPYVAAAKLKLDDTSPSPGYRIERSSTIGRCPMTIRSHSATRGGSGPGRLRLCAQLLCRR